MKGYLDGFELRQVWSRCMKAFLLGYSMAS